MSPSITIGLLDDLVSAVSGVALSCGLAYAAVLTCRELIPYCSTLRKISRAKAVPISDLRSLISSASSESESESSKEMFVIVHGITKENPRNWWSLTSKSNVFISRISKKKCVILEQTWERLPFKELPRHLYGKKGVFEKTTSLSKISFILREKGQGKKFDDLIVNLEDSSHSIPLTLVFDFLHEKFSGIRCPIRFAYAPEFLVKEKILPVGKELSVIGMCSLHEGKPQIKACKELPCFISELTRDEMIARLIGRRNSLIWASLFWGVLSLTALLYTFPKILRLWKEWKQYRRNETRRNETIQDPPDEQ